MFDDEKEAALTFASQLVAELLRTCGISEQRTNECAKAAMERMFAAEQGDEEAARIVAANTSVCVAQVRQVIDARAAKAASIN